MTSKVCSDCRWLSSGICVKDNARAKQIFLPNDYTCLDWDGCLSWEDINQRNKLVDKIHKFIEQKGWSVDVSHLNLCERTDSVWLYTYNWNIPLIDITMEDTIGGDIVVRRIVMCTAGDINIYLNDNCYFRHKGITAEGVLSDLLVKNGKIKSNNWIETTKVLETSLLRYQDDDPIVHHDLKDALKNLLRSIDYWNVNGFTDVIGKVWL